uniref:Uncharacterized protein n=1 Tax=Aegilops tauschii subsp. strangulata TaxID=200361 RepID=A0A452ZP38_AEGTS
ADDVTPSKSNHTPHCRRVPCSQVRSSASSQPMSRLVSRRHLAAAAALRRSPAAFASRWLHTPAFATVSPEEISGSSPAEVQNFGEMAGIWGICLCGLL